MAHIEIDFANKVEVPHSSVNFPVPFDMCTGYLMIANRPGANCVLVAVVLSIARVSPDSVTQ